MLLLLYWRVTCRQGAGSTLRTGRQFLLVGMVLSQLGKPWNICSPCRCLCHWYILLAGLPVTRSLGICPVHGMATVVCTSSSMACSFVCLYGVLPIDLVAWQSVQVVHHKRGTAWYGLEAAVKLSLLYAVIPLAQALGLEPV